ncbi:DUF2442 domain-containing protein [Methylobacter tundripaludum]|uniref:DUF2442 domain-containing protein n=1 Tax=Methylobacter tundripaludum (strain ATCC BAA-1195 / DSM 17260 / SV96) TaxID=697282 RepID=G3IX74_METTV|nr:DUF2442 domain-containing protein [Methylobacter tundripaludum]EGW22011.1 Protein of unknown function DUF2442 [Methylobacter tundripaludum SV96]
MILHVTDAKHLQDYQIWLKFNDDAEGVVDLSKELWGGMFEPLKDLSLFSQVKLDTELDTIVWPNGADLAPEFLHELLQQSQGTQHV